MNAAPQSAVGLMDAVLWTGPDAVSPAQVPLPEVPEGWALIKVEYTGLCGTDFSILHGTHPRAQAPLIMGHEITGTVFRRGASGPAEGTRVTVEPLIACGTCHPCTHGNPHVCAALRLYGIDAPGSLADYVALPPEVLLPIDAGVPPLEAALAEPLAVAVHAVERSGLSGGEEVLVFGAGPIGMLTALVAREAGAKHVIVSEPSPERRALAERLGFTAVDGGSVLGAVRDRTGGAGADIVFDSAGHPAVAAVMADAARVRGTVVVVGVYKTPAAVDLQAVNFKELTMVGTRVYERRDVERAVQLIEAGALGLGRLPVQVFPFSRAQEAFAVASSAGPVLKVLVSPEVAA